MATIGERLAQGDPAALTELYDALADRLHHYVVVYLEDRQDADEVLQETFLRLARNRLKLTKVENLDAYVFAMARNEARRLAGRRSRRQRKEQPLSAPEVFCVSSDLHARENAEALATALSHLSPELREVVELKTYARLTFQEMSHVTGLPQGTVATRYRIALLKLHACLRARLE
jgi:RNA polymerase sigma-70 factor (ECF subfamily)